MRGLGSIVVGLTTFEDGDIVVFAHTVVSKAEARRYLLTDIKPIPLAEELARLNNEDPRFIQQVLNNTTKIFELTGKKVAVIITDTNGRSFRDGQIGVTVGCSGIAALGDRRGDVDLFGHELKITIQAIADEVAACANMLMGEANEGTPIAIVRGYKYEESDEGIKRSFRPDDEDFVKRALLEKAERDEPKK